MTTRTRSLTHLFRRITLLTLTASLALIWTGSPTTAAPVRAAGTTGATPPPPGTLVHAASCEQAPPQSAKDRATYTPAELARYGLPPRAPGEPFAKWAKIVRSVARRVCDYTASSDRWWIVIPSEIFSGFIADESSPGQNYTHADMDYYVPCITGIPSDPPGGTPLQGGTAVMSAWIGLGGNNFDPYLIQAGTAAFQYWDPIHGYQPPVYRTFVENPGDSNDPRAHYFFNVSCNTHIYVRVDSPNCMFLLDIDTQVSTTNKCYGHDTSGLSGEALVERSRNTADYPYFARFNSVTFHGVAITDNGHYDAMYQVPHNQDQADLCTQYDQTGERCTGFDTTKPYATTGAIELDPNENPNDMYTVTWKYYGPNRT